MDQNRILLQNKMCQISPLLPMEQEIDVLETIWGQLEPSTPNKRDSPIESLLDTWRLPPLRLLNLKSDI
jgi:hypothetical protein